MPVHPDKQSGKNLMIALAILTFLALFIIMLADEGIDALAWLQPSLSFLVGSKIVAHIVIGVGLAVSLVAWVIFWQFRTRPLMWTAFTAMGAMVSLSFLFLMGNLLGVAGSIAPLISIGVLGFWYKAKGPTPPPEFLYQKKQKR